MKNIIFNKENIKEEEINNIVKRAKIVLINSKDEILLTLCHKNYYLIGGHVENNETDIETLKREILEETGIKLDINDIKPYFSIMHYKRNYPKENLISKFIANYYYYKTDILPDMTKTNLTEDEKKGKFQLNYINKNEILEIINNSLNTCTREGVVKDTILALEEFLNIEKK